MNKYTKIALIVLYVAQLAVAFRDQLTHVYVQVVAAVRPELETRPHGLESEKAPLATTLTRVDPVIGGTAAILIAHAHANTDAKSVIDGHHDDSRHAHPAHEHDDKAKDHRRRLRHTTLLRHQRLLLDLFPFHRVLAAHPAAETPVEPSTLRATPGRAAFAG